MAKRVPKKVILPANPPAVVMREIEVAWDAAFGGAGMEHLFRTVYFVIFDMLPAVREPRKPRLPQMMWSDLYWSEPEPRPAMFWLGHAGELEP